MTENEVLNALVEYIKSVTADLRFVKGGDKQVTELVPPAVYEGWVPPKNYLTEYGYDVPCVVVGMDEGEDDGQSAKLGIRLTFGIYSPGAMNTEGQIIPDAKGYIELLHLMTRVRVSLLNQVFINGKCEIEKPVKWGMFDEQLWPYWHGWMTFNTPLMVQRVIEKNYDAFLRTDSNIEIPVETI
ncbi:MAG TPA: hypothetical protein VEG39_01770 [Clostridia bacterium]|nr:hypothetical protein [Clostridia bacterium]